MNSIKLLIFFSVWYMYFECGKCDLSNYTVRMEDGRSDKLSVLIQSWIKRVVPSTHQMMMYKLITSGQDHISILQSLDVLNLYVGGGKYCNKSKFKNCHFWNSMCSQYTCIVSFTLHSNFERLILLSQLLQEKNMRLWK